MSVWKIPGITTQEMGTPRVNMDAPENYGQVACHEHHKVGRWHPFLDQVQGDAPLLLKGLYAMYRMRVGLCDYCPIHGIPSDLGRLDFST